MTVPRAGHEPVLSELHRPAIGVLRLVLDVQDRHGVKENPPVFEEFPSLAARLREALAPALVAPRVKVQQERRAIEVGLHLESEIGGPQHDATQDARRVRAEAAAHTNRLRAPQRRDRNSTHGLGPGFNGVEAPGTAATGP